VVCVSESEWVRVGTGGGLSMSKNGGTWVWVWGLKFNLTQVTALVITCVFELFFQLIIFNLETET